MRRGWRGADGSALRSIVMFALLVSAALAAPIVHGERLEWAVSWMGIDAGSAWSTTSESGPAWIFEAGARSAGWLVSLYPIDDLLRSEWTAGLGSARYFTRFREGRFQQDQDNRFGADAVVVSRTQLRDEVWQPSESRYAAAPGVEDPVSAFYRIREEAGPVGERTRWTVWTGKNAIPMIVHTAAAEAYAGQAALRVEVLADHDTDDVEPKLTVWLTDDAARVPLAAVLHTRAGAVKATLVERTVGG